MAERRRDRTGERNDEPPGVRCQACGSPDPQIRSTHQLGLSKAGGLDGLRAHLQEHYGLQLDGERRREAIASVCGWVGHLMERYSGLADPQTGAPLPWWQARTYFMGERESIALAAQRRAPWHITREVVGFARVQRAEDSRGGARPGVDIPPCALCGSPERYQDGAVWRCVACTRRAEDTR